MSSSLKMAAAEEGFELSGKEACCVEAVSGEKGPVRCFHLLGLDYLLDQDGKCWLLEVNSLPSLALGEVMPVDDVDSWSSANFSDRALDDRTQIPTHWGPACFCQAWPGPHSHRLCPVDMAVKLPVARGMLEILRRATTRSSPDL